VEKFLDSEHGADERAFYASFINYCTKQVVGAKNPTSENKSDIRKELTNRTVANLRSQPLTADAFVDLMKVYCAYAYKNGNFATGHAKPDSKSEYAMPNVWIFQSLMLHSR